MASELSPPESTRKTLLLLAGGIFLAACVVYGRSFDYGLVHIDDPGYVGDNPHVMNGLTGTNIRWAFSAIHRSNWHPLTWLSLQLDATIFGRRFGGFHLTNALLHAMTSVLLLLALARMTGSVLRSATVAALFALHPQHVESVAWVTERKDVLCMAFGMGALLAYARYVHFGGVLGGVRRYLLVVLLYSLSLLSKPLLVTLPCVLILLDIWPLRRFTRAMARRVIAEKIPLLALAIAISFVTVAAQKQGLAIKSELAFPLSERIGNALLAVVWYLRQTFWPVDLAVIYPHTHASLTEPRVLLAAGLLIAITIASLLLARRSPAILIGWLWFLGGLFPVLGIVYQQGWQGMADRYVYWPHIGLFIALVWPLADLAARLHLPLRLTAAFTGLVLIACAGLTIHQVGYWRNAETLARRALEVQSPNPPAEVGWGIVLLSANKAPEALQHFKKALEADPSFIPAMNRTAETLCILGRPLDAIPLYERLVQEQPTSIARRLDLAQAELQANQFDKAAARYLEALQLQPDRDEALLGRGTALHMASRFVEAQPNLEQAVHQQPRNPNARYRLGRNLLAIHKEKEAIQEFQQVMRLQPDRIEAIDLLCLLLCQQKQFDAALDTVTAGLVLQPTSGLLLSTAARIQHLRGDQPAAAVLYDRATKSDPRWPQQVFLQSWRWSTTSDSAQRFPKYAEWLAWKLTEAFPKRPEGHDALAAAFAASGQFDEAVKEAEKALSLAQDRPDFVKVITERLDGYRQRKPFVQP